MESIEPGACAPGALGSFGRHRVYRASVHITGASGTIAWQVTDFRIVARSVQGTPRDLYTFTLVLQETQGSALTFRQVVSRLTHPSIPTLPQQSSVLWQLRPRGELR